MKSEFPVVTIGAAAGGLDAIRTITEALPAGYGAALALVFHVGRYRSNIPEILNWHGRLPALFPRDGDAFRPGRIYVAPPDRHLRLEPPDRIGLISDAPVHHMRPAIDPLFESAARTYGQRVVGVVLSGLGKDGAAGLRFIREHGGVALVQDPAEATVPQMPAATFAADDPEVLPIDRLATRVARFCSGFPS